MGGRTVSVALACWRPTLRGVWRQALALALLTGLLGGVALGAVAGARRTAGAYQRYLAVISASDVFVNVPGQLPEMSATRSSRRSACSASSARCSRPPPAAAHCPPLTRSSWAR
jgi:hypothetical protein